MTSNAEHTEFTAFIGELRPRALAGQISPHVFDAAFLNIAPLPEILAAQENQAEFALSPRAYFARVVPKLKVRKGRENIRKWRDDFNAIEACFGVNAETIAAIWGVETDYGRHRGTHSVIAALATLAWRGRRAAFFEGELIAALKIIQHGHITAPEMLGSWAGAMGHGQFMPSSFLAHPVDYDDDGRANIWHDDPVDGLASIAQYLAQNGWQNGAPWGQEIRIPAGFDYGHAGLQNTAQVSEWIAMGLTLPNGEMPGDYGPASVLLPTGAQGPAFLVSKNFRVLLKYNNAILYGLAVGSLAELIGGARPLPEGFWPDDPPLLRAEFAELQAALTKIGYDAGTADGLQGPDTARAICAYQKAVGLPADGHASSGLLTKLRESPR